MGSEILAGPPKAMLITAAILNHPLVQATTMAALNKGSAIGLRCSEGSKARHVEESFHAGRKASRISFALFPKLCNAVNK